MFAGLREQVPAEQSVGIIFEIQMTKTNVGYACMKRHLPFVGIVQINTTYGLKKLYKVREEHYESFI